MSCVYVNGSLERKEVNDIKVGTGTGSEDRIDVQKVVRWDGTILWNRGIPFTDENVRFDIDTTGCSKEDETGYWDYDCRPAVSNVEFYNGDEWVPLSQSSDYEVGYRNNTGRLESSGETTTATGYVILKGIGKYTGNVETNFQISYTKVTYNYLAFETPYPDGSGTCSASPSGEPYVGGVYKYRTGTQVTATVIPTRDDEAGIGYAFEFWIHSHSSGEYTSDIDIHSNPTTFSIVGNEVLKPRMCGAYHKHIYFMYSKNASYHLFNNTVPQNPDLHTYIPNDQVWCQGMSHDPSDVYYSRLGDWDYQSVTTDGYYKDSVFLAPEIALVVNNLTQKTYQCSYYNGVTADEAVDKLNHGETLTRNTSTYGLVQLTEMTKSPAYHFKCSSDKVTVCLVL